MKCPAMPHMTCSLLAFLGVLSVAACRMPGLPRSVGFGGYLENATPVKRTPTNPSQQVGDYDTRSPGDGMQHQGNLARPHLLTPDAANDVRSDCRCLFRIPDGPPPHGIEEMKHRV